MAMTYDPSAAVAEFEETLTDVSSVLGKDGKATLVYTAECRDALRAALTSAHAAGEAGKEAEYERGKRDAYLNVLADASGGLMDAVMDRAPWDVEEEIRDKARRHGVTGEEFGA